jgi:AcrR family transcriptional regulator
MNPRPNARPLPRRTQRERRELSHHRMLDAALTLIARQGSSRTTLSQIGEASGYTHGLVSHRFGCKSELVRTLIQKLQTDFAKSILPELTGKTGIKALKFVAEKYLRATAEKPRLALYVLIGEALGPVPEIRPDPARADENFRSSIQKHIEEGIRTGEIRATVDARTQAALILATLRGLVIQRILHPNSLEIESVCRDMKSNLERTLRSAKS